MVLYPCNEREWSDLVLGLLEPTFNVTQQVASDPYGFGPSTRTLYLDAVLKPHDPSEWYDDDPAFGIEFKSLQVHAEGMNKRTGHAAQSVDYALTEWLGFGRLQVFMAPSPFRDELGVTEKHLPSGSGWQFAQHLVGQLGVGELVYYKKGRRELTGRGWETRYQVKGLALLLQGEMLWSEVDGVMKAKWQSLKPRIGSR